MPFVKLDTGIPDSSLWREPASTCKCWITMLAMADPSGLVRSTAPGIANRSHLSLKQTQKALETFESPDPHSRSLNDEGRKVRRVDGGYQIINYEKYRKFDHTAAERMKRHRERVTRNERNASDSVSISDSDKKEEKKARPKNQSEVEAFCRSIGLTKSDGEAMWLDWQDRGFGKTKDWKAKIRRWKIHGYHPSQKQKRNGAHPDNLKPLDRSKIDLPESFKSWASGKYPDKRDKVMAWRTWADAPNSLREEWWTERKSELPGSIGELL